MHRKMEGMEIVVEQFERLSAGGQEELLIELRKLAAASQAHTMGPELLREAMRRVGAILCSEETPFH